MMRLIVHPGFHKTGTSTVQTQLRAARSMLAPDWVIGLREDIPDAPAAARAYSAGRDPLELGLFQAALADWFESLDLSRARGVLISAEGLCGHMPGRPETSDYSAAAPLMAALAKVAQAVFGTALDLRFHLSTRATAEWLPSLHWQHVRTGTLSEPLAAFAARMAPHTDLAAEVAAIAGAVAPWPVTALPLETSSAMAQGPISPLLDLMGLDAAARGPFSPEASRNARPKTANPAALANRFARINADSGEKTLASTRKRATLARLRAQTPKDDHA